MVRVYTETEFKEFMAGLAVLEAELKDLRAVADAARTVRRRYAGYVNLGCIAANWDALADALDAYDALKKGGTTNG